MGGEIERMLAESDMVLTRLGVDIFGPVPIAPMTLETEVVRAGKRVQFIDASLSVEDRVIVRAHGVGLRRGDHDVPFGEPDPVSYPSPQDAAPVNFFKNPGAFATDAMEVRMAAGDFDQAGPGVGWFRMRVPVTPGTEPTPVETACAAADFGNGVSNWDPQFSWMFINPDLTIHFTRPPVGDWVLLDSVTHAHNTGTGLTQSALVDEDGLFGRSAQSLLVEPFGGRG